MERVDADSSPNEISCTWLQCVSCFTELEELSKVNASQIVKRVKTFHCPRRVERGYDRSGEMRTMRMYQSVAEGKATSEQSSRSSGLTHATSSAGVRVLLSTSRRGGGRRS